MTTKLSKETTARPQTVKKRSYKYFSGELFLQEIKYSDFSPVLLERNVSQAASKFSEIFSSILENHAPLKVFQMRKNYAPWLSDSLKGEINKRNELKSLSSSSNNPETLIEYKTLRNRIRAKVKNEEPDYYKKKYDDCGNDSKSVWNTSYEILGQNKDVSPKQICYQGELISSPLQLAEAFNEIFLMKVAKVKAEISDDITTQPNVRLNQWLNNRQNPIPNFELKEISRKDLNKYIK